MDEYMICDTLAEAVEVIEATFKAHVCDIGDVDMEAEAQLAHYFTEDEGAIGLIALVDGVPWDKLPAIYVPAASLTDMDRRSLSGWLLFSAPSEETGEMTCLREAGSDADDD